MIDVHAHAVALLDLIRSKGLTVHDGQVPTGAKAPYVVAYLDGGARSSESLAEDFEQRAEFDGEFYSVGDTPQQARWVQSRVLSIVGSGPAVTGRSTTVRHVFSDRVQRDTDNPQQVVFQARDGLTLVSLKG
jgi:hypothetical protein